MGKPQVPIEVDDATGVWTVDAIPMILVPRHFLVNNHKAVEAAVGAEANARLLFEAGHRSAWVWCEKEAATHGLAGVAVFHHYMKRLSQRGWAQFSVETIDPEAGTAAVRVAQSVFVAEQPDAGRKVCYMFRGWFCGALEYVARRTPFTLDAQETRCAAETPGDCLFSVHPRRA